MLKMGFKIEADVFDIYMSHVTHMPEYCRTLPIHAYGTLVCSYSFLNIKNGVQHWGRHVWYLYESCHAYAWVPSHSTHSCMWRPCVLLFFINSKNGVQHWGGRVGYLYESCHTYDWVLSHSTHSWNSRYHTYRAEPIGRRLEGTPRVHGYLI